MKQAKLPDPRMCCRWHVDCNQVTWGWTNSGNDKKMKDDLFTIGDYLMNLLHSV